MQELLTVVTGAAPASDLGIWSLVEQSTLVVKGVMALLGVMSVVGWYIIFYKWLYVRRAASQTERFVDSFWRSRDIEHIYKNAQALRASPVSSMFLAGYSELAKLSSDKQSARDLDAD